MRSRRVLIAVHLWAVLVSVAHSAMAGPRDTTPADPPQVEARAATEQAVEAQAWAEDTAAAFQRAVKTMPRGTVSSREVKARLEYLKAVAPGTLQAYEQFLRRQPDHLFAGEANKTLLGLRLATRPLGLLISITRLSRDDLTLSSVRDEFSQRIREELSRMGWAVTLMNQSAASAPGRGEATGPGGRLIIEYEEAPG